MKKILYILSFALLLGAYSCIEENEAYGTWKKENLVQNLKTDTKIIAHRGYYKELAADGETVTQITAENSMASLKGSLDIDIYGTEFDVIATADDVLLIFHDPKINEVPIQINDYELFKDHKLSNGEKIPFFSDYLQEGVKQSKVKLVLEIKNDEEMSFDREVEVAELIYNEIKKYKAEGIVEYISYSKPALDKIISLDPKAKVSLLSYKGISTARPMLSPKELKSQRYYGLDYERAILRDNKKWFGDGKEFGIATNVWTVNDKKTMLEFINLGVDYITTDYPGYLKGVIDEYNEDKK